MTRSVSIIYFLLLTTATFAFTDESKALGLWIDSSAFQEQTQSGIYDPDYTPPPFYVADLNGDGTTDYLTRGPSIACGTGGCPYDLYDGKTKKHLGAFFGSIVLLLDQKINGFPVIQLYSRGGRISSFTTYVFDGKEYQEVSSVSLSGESVKTLFKKLEKFRKAKQKGS